MSDSDRPERMGGHSPSKLPAYRGIRIQVSVVAVDVSIEIAMLLEATKARTRRIIGQRGVAALFNRSVQLAATPGLWFNLASEHHRAGPRCSAFVDCLFHQLAAAAEFGGDVLLPDFHQLPAPSTARVVQAAHPSDWQRRYVRPAPRYSQLASSRRPTT